MKRVPSIAIQYNYIHPYPSFSIPSRPDISSPLWRALSGTEACSVLASMTLWCTFLTSVPCVGPSSISPFCKIYLALRVPGSASSSFICFLHNQNHFVLNRLRRALYILTVMNLLDKWRSRFVYLNIICNLKLRRVATTLPYRFWFR